MATNSEAFVQNIVQTLSALGDVSARPMFGGHGVFAAGKMFALISKDTIYFKADDENRPLFEAAGRSSYGKIPYFQAPPDSAGKKKQIVALAEGALAAALRAPSKPKKSGRNSLTKRCAAREHCPLGTRPTARGISLAHESSACTSREACRAYNPGA